jgi:hypothetical protein
MNTCINIVRTVAILGVIAMATGCGSSGKLRSDYDPTADFSQYETYNFFSDAGPEDTNYQSFFSKYMVAAISREMEKRGYTKSNDPDLLVNFNAILQDKTDVRTVPSTMGMGYYGYRGGFYDPWMGYGYATETHVSQYTEGTFNIDLVDARRKKLVWEAVGVGRISEKDLEQLEERVNEGVPKFFEAYPFMAGSGTPVAPE